MVRRRWIVAIVVLLIAVLVITLFHFSRVSQQNQSVLGPSATQPNVPAPRAPESGEPEPAPESDMPEMTPDQRTPGLSPTLPPTTGEARARTRPRIRPRPRKPATIPSATQPQATGDSFVPGDAYVPPTPQPAPGGPGGAAGASSKLLFTLDGKLLVVAASGSAEFCDLVSGQRRALGASLGDARILSIASDGRTVITHDAGGVVRLFDTTAWRPQTTTYTPDVAAVKAIALSPDGRTIALAGHGVAVWDMIDRKLRTTLDEKAASVSVSFSADGHSLAVATPEGATLWDTTMWQKQATLAAGGGAEAVRFWPARSALAVAAGDHTIRVFDLATRQVQITLNAGGGVSDFAVSSDGRTVAAIGATGVTVWDAATGVARHLP